VDQEQLAKACAAARKAPKPGYKMCYLLLKAVFSMQEIAQSRGQGLTKPKEGDYREPLDKRKVAATKGLLLLMLSVSIEWYIFN